MKLVDNKNQLLHLATCPMQFTLPRGFAEAEEEMDTIPVSWLLILCCLEKNIYFKYKIAPNVFFGHAEFVYGLSFYISLF